MNPVQLIDVIKKGLHGKVKYFEAATELDSSERKLNILEAYNELAHVVINNLKDKEGRFLG